MRNLKKVLALVLALVMSLSLVTIANAATFTDADDIKTYKEAVEVLADLDVIQGKGNDNYEPQSLVTRAEMATILYRATTGDVKGKNAPNNQTYGTIFTDVAKGSWYAGYVGYAANAGYVKGKGNNNYDPNGNVTGYEVLVMMLRALGYTKEDEFTGKNGDWRLESAVLAKSLGMLENVTKEDLNDSASRELVAELVFRAIFAPVVNHTALQGYQPIVLAKKGDTVGDLKYPDDVYQTLAYKNWSILKGVDGRSVWGEPSTVYPEDSDGDYFIGNSDRKGGVANADWTKKVAEVPHEPILTFYDKKTQCDIADELGSWYSKIAGYTAYVNGAGCFTSTDPKFAEIDDTDITDTLGQPGRTTKIFADGSIVYYDTFAAVVTNVTKRTFDVAGHVMTPATLTVTVYSSGLTTNGNNTQSLTVSSSLADYPYSNGQILAANVRTDWDGSGATETDNKLDTNSKIVKVAATTEQTVTVERVIRDNGNTIVGIRGTDGKAYMYNASVNGDRRLDTTAIGSTVKVYTDANGYVLATASAETATSGYGVITDWKVADLGKGEYAIEYTILDANGSTVTWQVYDGASITSWKADISSDMTSATPFKKVDEANTDAATFCTDKAPQLVKYGTMSGKKYVMKGESGGTKTEIFSADADALDGTLVNDGTTFFVVNYPYKNSQSQYVENGITIYKGFKSIPDLSIVSGTFANAPASAKTNLTVTYIDANNFGASPATDDAEYVLVVYANGQDTPDTYTVPNYAFVVTEGMTQEIGDDYHVYNAVINGGSVTQLRTTNTAALITEPGLYTYENQKSEGWDKVTKATSTAKAPVYSPDHGSTWQKQTSGQYSYSEGVITLETGAQTLKAGDNQQKYLAVADNCPVYVINQVTGKTNAITLADLATYNACDIAFQFNANNYVSLIYVIAANPVHATPEN